MQITISTRHGQLSEATREKVAAKVEKLTRVFERITAIEVTVDLQHRDAPSVDVRVNAEHKHDIVATEQADELMAALDKVLPKLEQQIRKYKEKIQEHHRPPNPRQEGFSAQQEAGGT